MSKADGVNDELQEHAALPSSDDDTESITSSDDVPDKQQLLRMSDDASDAVDGGLEEQTTDGQQLTSDATNVASFDRADVFGVSTLVVRKGQQLQELVVSGSITKEQLRDETEKIVALLLSPEGLM